MKKNLSLTFFVFAVILVCFSIGCKSEPSSASQDIPNPPTAIYLVIFDANGGFGTMPAQNFIKDETKALSANIFTMPDKVFTGWNTSADGTGTSYIDAQNYTATGNITLYAQWADIAFVVTFDKNDGSGETVIQPFALWISQPLKANTFTITDKVFTGWNTSADGTGISYADGQFHIATENITLYAQWRDLYRFTVTFDKNDGSGTKDTQIFKEGQAQNLKTNPFTITNKFFIGWNTNADGTGISYADAQNYCATEDITLYALWGNIYTVTFVKNDGSGITATQIFREGQVQNLTTRENLNLFDIPELKRFVSWNTSADGTGTSYKDGQSYTATGNITLYAQWDFAYLCFTAEEPNSWVLLSNRDRSVLGGFPILEYSTDGIHWTDFVIGDETRVTLPNVGDKIYLRGDNRTFSKVGSDGYFFFRMGGSIAASGNIMSLLDKTCQKKSLDYTVGCFYKLFKDCSSLSTAPELPATTLTARCYAYMFAGCSKLEEAPEIPATTVGESCCESMFEGCYNLKKAPEVLPATTLAKRCYAHMFDAVYSVSWGGALRVAPELPATTLAESCYEGMFKNCIYLEEVPELPATRLAKRCYAYMFEGCRALGEYRVPKLPATTLAESCYEGMFSGCSALGASYVDDGSVHTIELPATTLAPYCYKGMFSGCDYINHALYSTHISELPATTLAPYCYESMFSDCDYLEIAPELPATTLVEGCYKNMFNDCGDLRYVKVAFSDWAVSKHATDGWLEWTGYGEFFVDRPPTFLCPSSLPIDIRNGDTVPGEGYYRSYWTIVRY